MAPFSPATVGRGRRIRCGRRGGFTRSAHAVMLAWGWRRAAIAFGAGRRRNPRARAIQPLAAHVPDLSGRWSG